MSRTKAWQLRTKVRAGEVSTVRLPFPHPGGEYETCIFFRDHSSEVVERYETQDEAARGHERHVSEHGGKVLL